MTRTTRVIVALREIYGSPSDPALRAEYEAYLKKRLAEIRAKYPK